MKNIEDFSSQKKTPPVPSGISSQPMLLSFEKYAQQTPDAIAITSGDQYLSYQTMQSSIYHLAHQLQEEGIRERSTVALFELRNIEMLIALLAIVKAGGTMLLLDLAASPLHLSQHLEVSRCSILLTSHQESEQKVHVLERLSTQLQPRILRYKLYSVDHIPGNNSWQGANSAETACVIQVTGEFGNLQTAIIEQEKILEDLYTKIDHLQLSARDWVAAVAPLGDVISLWQYLAALFVGGKVDIIPDEILFDPFAFIEYLVTRAISVLEVADPLLLGELEGLSEQDKNHATLGSLRTIIMPERTSFIECVEEAPLSFAQERQWILSQLEPANPFYIIPIVLPLPGNVRVPLLEQSFHEVVRRHAVLRTTFANRAGEPIQVITPATLAQMPRITVVHLPKDEVSQKVYEETRLPFDLMNGPLLRATLFLSSEEESLLLLTIHHSVFDGWSIDILLREIAQCYRAQLQGEPANLPELSLQYSDFARWQRHWFEKDGYQAHIAYWQQHMHQPPALSQFPLDYPRPASQTYEGESFQVELPPELLTELSAICQRENVTLFMLLLAAFQALLFRYTHQEDLVIGTPIANRTRVETEALIGCFVNTLPLRVSLNGDLTFAQLLKNVRQITSEAYTYQDLPFEKLLDLLKLERDNSRSPLFQILFVLQNTPLATYEIEGRPLVPTVLTNGTTIFELVLAFKTDADSLFLNVQYNTAIFTERTVRQFISHYQVVLTAIVENLTVSLATLPLLTTEEQRLLLLDPQSASQDDEGQPSSVHEIFETWVARHPQSIAVSDEKGALSYQKLDTVSTWLAGYLKEQGVTLEKVVAMCIESSTKLVIAILAILKAGGAYMPLDKSFPQERLIQMMQKTGAHLLLASRSTVQELPQEACPLLVIDDLLGELLAVDRSPSSLPTRVSKDNLCYIVHTSGSTGAPKGIAMTHRPLLNLLRWEQELKGAIPILYTMQFAPPIFDMLFLEIFFTFLQGGTLKFLSSERRDDPEYILSYMKREQIGRINLSFTALQQLSLVAQQTGLVPDALQEIDCGGEQLQATPELRWLLKQLPNCRLFNTYGPSEAHSITEYLLPADTACWPTLPPIGFPGNNIQILILDEQLSPVPILVEGELYVGGPCLSRGYLNQPDVTAERFIPNPFGARGARLYKTGDHGRYLPDGSIEFLGRRDTQVKLRGYRIELGEIELVLRKHPLIKDCVVSVIGEQEHKRIVAYVIAAQTDREFSAVLHTYMRNHFPTYMSPSSYIILEAFPLSATGKTDRRKLDALYSNLATPSVPRDHTQPRNDLERLLVDLWGNVLQIEDVGIHENFFSLGGQSLLAIKLLLLIRSALQISIELRELFEYPTVAQLASHVIEQEIAEADEELVTTLLEQLAPRSDL